MNIKIIGQSLFNEMQDVVDSYENKEKISFTSVNNGIEKLLHGAECCKEMTYNGDKISDKNFYSMLKEFAYISDWNDFDFYNVLELAYNMKFDKVAVIKTRMHAITDKVEGRGKDFSWWKEEVGIDFKVLCTYGFSVDCNHVYSTEEIKKLINEKKIVIVSQEERSLALDKQNYEKEKYEKFATAYNSYNIKQEFFSEDGKYYKYTLKYIRKMLDKEKLNSLFSEHLKHTEYEIMDAVDSSNYESDSWKTVSKEYSKEFENKGYAKKLSRLTSNHE